MKIYFVHIEKGERGGRAVSSDWVDEVTLIDSIKKI